MDCEGSGGSFDPFDAYHYETDELGRIKAFSINEMDTGGSVPFDSYPSKDINIKATHDTGCHIVYDHRGLLWEFSINPAAILEKELTEIKGLLRQILETLNKKG